MMIIEDELIDLHFEMAEDPTTTPQMLEAIYFHYASDEEGEFTCLLAEIALNPSASDELIERIIEHEPWEVRVVIAMNTTNRTHQQLLAEDEEELVLLALWKNPALHEDTKLLLESRAVETDRSNHRVRMMFGILANE